MKQNQCNELLWSKYDAQRYKKYYIFQVRDVQGHFTAHIWVFTCLAAEAVYILTRYNSRIKCTQHFFWSVGNRGFFTGEKCGPGMLAPYSLFNQS
jgi:hypothetical protein